MSRKRISLSSARDIVGALGDEPDFNPESVSQLKDMLSKYDTGNPREDDFMYNYGDMFNDDRSLGLAILNELDRRGVDTSAADEAVQEILDQLRMEVNQLQAVLAGTQKAMEATVDKINTVAESVDNAVASNPDSTEQPLPEIEFNPNDEFNPDNVPQESVPDMSQQAPVEQSMPQESVPDMSQQAPVEQSMSQGVLDPSMIADNTTLSDARMKDIKAYRARRTRPAVESFKPSAGILSAATGGRF